MSWFNNDLLFVATYDPQFDTSRNENDSKWNLYLFDRKDIIQHFGENRNGMPNSSSIVIDTHNKHLYTNNNSSNLERSKYFCPLLVYPLTNHPIGMECVDCDKLLIYFVDGVIHVYDININVTESNLKSSIVASSIVNANKQRPSMSLGPVSGLTMSSPKMGLSEEFENDLQARNVDEMANDILNDQFDANITSNQHNNNHSSNALGNSHLGTRMNNSQHNQQDSGLMSYFFGSGSANSHRTHIVTYSLKNYCVLAPFQTLSPHPVAIRLWKNDKQSPNDDHAGFSILSLDASRTLYEIDPISNEKSLIAKNIHDFFLVRETREYSHSNSSSKHHHSSHNHSHHHSHHHHSNHNHHHNSHSHHSHHTTRNITYLWTYGNNDKVQRWNFKDFKNPLTVGPIHPEMTSIGLCNILNVFVYGRRMVRQVNCDINGIDGTLCMPKYAVHIDIRSYLHIAIKDKIDRLTVELTFDFVLKAIAGGAWRCLNALETVLRHALSKEESHNAHKIVQFLRKFPDYSGIVVNVARKTEPTTWSDLFMLCGPPCLLIEESIQRNQLATASKYLYVLEKIDINYAIHYTTLYVLFLNFVGVFMQHLFDLNFVFD